MDVVETTSRFPGEPFAKDLPSLKEWLSQGENRLGAEAYVVYQSWLRAGGRFVVIRKEVFDWVMANGLERDAGYLLKHVVKQRVIPDDVTLKILAWCANFANDRDAIWRLNSLSAHISGDLFVEALQASAAVFEPIFANENLEGLTRSQVTTVLGNLAKLEHLASAGPSPELDALLCRWMNHPQSFEPIARHAPYHHTRAFLTRLLGAAEGAATTPELWPLIDWISSWDEPLRLSLKDVIKRIRHLRHTSTGGRPRARPGG